MGAEGRGVDFVPGSSCSAGETGSEAAPQGSDPSCWLRARGSHGMQEKPIWNQEALQRVWAGDAGIPPPKILRRQEGLSFLAAQSRVVPGSFCAANLGSGFDRWSRSSPAALTQQGPTPRGPAVPLDPHWEGWNQPGRGLGVICAPSTRNAVPGEAGNGDTGCLDDPTLHSRGRALPLGYRLGVVSPPPNPVEPHPPSRCFPSPSAPALDHLFFMSAAGRCLGKAELEEAALGYSGQRGKSAATALSLPIPKCSGAASMEPGALSAPETTALRILMSDNLRSAAP